jgi:CRP-like cAMP-binding protein
MDTKGIDALVREHAFFQGLPDASVKLIAGCGKNVKFAAGKPLARQDAEADVFFAIRAGRVAVELHHPGRGACVLQTVGPGEILGWSWLFPPYRWAFDSRAVEEVRAVQFDGACLRKKCEADPAFGYSLMKRFAGVFARRLEATRVQLLDLYGKNSDA